MNTDITAIITAITDTITDITAITDTGNIIGKIGNIISDNPFLYELHLE